MVIDVLPDNVRKERAKELLSKGRLEEARVLLSDLCRDDQRDVETWLLFSTANAHLGRFEDVITACRKALEIDPEYLPAQNSLASALAAAGRHAESATEFAVALRMAPDNPMVLNNYAHALALSGRVDEARATLENAVRIQPHYADAHYNLAALLEQKGDSIQALQEYEQAIALKPGLISVCGERLDRLRKIVRGAA